MEVVGSSLKVLVTVDRRVCMVLLKVVGSSLKVFLTVDRRVCMVLLKVVGSSLFRVSTVLVTVDRRLCMVLVEKGSNLLRISQNAAEIMCSEYADFTEAHVVFLKISLSALFLGTYKRP